MDRPSWSSVQYVADSSSISSRNRVEGGIRALMVTMILIGIAQG
jgi:hypothetical protein